MYVPKSRDRQVSRSVAMMAKSSTMARLIAGFAPSIHGGSM